MMKSFFGVKRLAVFCAVLAAIGLTAASASALPDKGEHEKFMKNEDYKTSWEQYQAVMSEARERLTADEYKALEKENDEAIDASAKESLDAGEDPAGCWGMAYEAQLEHVGSVLRWDYLKKNAKGVQGYYRLKSDAFDGYLTVEEGDEKDSYAVGVSVAMKGNAENSGDFEGLGKLEGKKMTVTDGGDDSAPVVLTFDGETAKLTTSKAFKEGDFLGEGVTLDGEYLREKK